MSFEVQALRGDGWHTVSYPATDREATADVAAERERDGRRTAVRVMGDDGNGVRVQLRVWGPSVAAPIAAGPWSG